MDVLGIIAGNRSLPFELARGARAAGVPRLVAAAFEGETDPSLASLVDRIEWFRVGQLDRMIRFFVAEGVQQCVMVGQIAPKNLFDLRPDLRAMKLLFRLKEKNAHTVFGAIANELAADGITLIEAIPWLQKVIPPAGFSMGRSLTAQEEEDVAYGFGIAKEVSRLEIGQTVVVKGGSVLAVEGFEGTDRCLTRGGELAGKGGGGVAVKVSKHQHDMRFDIPCVGRTTIEVCAAAGIQVMAFEGGKTLLLDQSELKETLRRHKFALLARA